MTYIGKLNALLDTLPSDRDDVWNKAFTALVDALPIDKHGSKAIQCADCRKCYMEHRDGEPEYCPNCGS